MFPPTPVQPGNVIAMVMTNSGGTIKVSMTEFWAITAGAAVGAGEGAAVTALDTIAAICRVCEYALTIKVSDPYIIPFTS